MSDKVEIIKKVFSLFNLTKELEVKHEIVDEDFNSFEFLDYTISEAIEDDRESPNFLERVWDAFYLEIVYDNEIGNDANYIDLTTQRNFLKALEACAVDYFQRGVHSFLENDYENLYLDKMEAAKKAEAESGGVNESI